jgi:dTDP-D-glucose 4,6-dehydratase
LDKSATVAPRIRAKTENADRIDGGAGFIGSHLTGTLIAAGHQVVILDECSTSGYKNIAQLEQMQKLQVICRTITDSQLVREWIRDTNAAFYSQSAASNGFAFVELSRSQQEETASETVLEYSRELL